MKRSADLADLARRAVYRVFAALCAVLLAGQMALAGDRALTDFLGYSPDARYFAFEEFGIQDGSGFAYSHIYVIDLHTDRWVPKTPIRRQAEDEAAGLSWVRQMALADAASIISDLEISVPADLIALNGDGAPDREARTLQFGVPLYLPSMLTDTAVLRLDTFPAASADPCAEWFDIEAQGFALSLTNSEGERLVYRDGKKLPASRGCAFNYRIYGVVVPFGHYASDNAVVMISVYPGGFEGPDRRFLAVPLGQ
jgi:predicted secreted protein